MRKVILTLATLMSATGVAFAQRASSGVMSGAGVLTIIFGLLIAVGFAALIWLLVVYLYKKVKKM